MTVWHPVRVQLGIRGEFATVNDHKRYDGALLMLGDDVAFNVPLPPTSEAGRLHWLCFAAALSAMVLAS